MFASKEPKLFTMIASKEPKLFTMIASKEPKLFTMIAFLTVGLWMTGGVAAQTSDSTNDTQTPMTTEVFSNVFGGDPITLVLPASVSESAPVPQPACGSIPSHFGFIGIPCSLDQPSTLSSVTSSVISTRTGMPFNGPATITTVITDSLITTKTAAPMTVTKTISIISQSALPNTTVTAMCYWSDENIITPCTTAVLNTGALTSSSASAVPTASKSTAIPTARNPFKTPTELVKRSINYVSTFLNSLLFSGSTDTINVYPYPSLTDDRTSLNPDHRYSHTSIHPRSIAIKCLQPPYLFTPAIMTVFAVLNACVVFCSWDLTRPSRTGNIVALYILSFIAAYLVAIYVEYFFITVTPMWRECIATTGWWNETLSGGVLHGNGAGLGS